MSTYAPPLDEMRFILESVLDLDGAMAALPGCEDVNIDLASAVLEEAGKLCSEVIAPINLSGDRQGATLADGMVTTPKGYAEAYRAFAAGHWTGLSGDPAFGGQGLPRVLQIAVDEMLCSSSISFSLFPGLSRGAIEAIHAHAGEDLKAAYLPKLMSGEWTGVMALTEAAAGTDLGLLKTRAEPLGAGRYRISGTKIFISSGDHDFGGNIVHLVLARLPDAAEGVKGVSMFLVPKFLLAADGAIGTRNAVNVGALEHKMGIHAQPTCVINYDGAEGYLVGDAGRGLNAMFTMMNAERLFVGVQGLGIAEAAYQKARAYAAERRQGRSPLSGESPAPILAHADVRRMLLSIRAFTGAGRALALWIALELDRAARHPDADVRRQAGHRAALLTPVIKAAFTDLGFESAVAAQQVFGGHGYIHEWGMEQFVRDARITQIYEGTNGVQAMDLVARKLPVEDGAVVRAFLAEIRRDLDAADVDPAIAAPVGDALDRLEAATARLLLLGNDVLATGAVATDYLRLFALTCLGWMWARMVSVAAGQADRTQKERVAAAAAFFAERILPQTLALDASIAAGAASTVSIPDHLV